MEKNFSIKQAFVFGFNAFCDNFFLLLALAITFGFIVSLPEILKITLGIKIPQLIDLIYSSVAGSMMMLCLIKFFLNCYDQTQDKLDGVLSQWHLIGKYILTHALYSLIILLGFVFFIIPGIYLAIRLFFYDYAIVDKNSSVIGSLKESWQITQGVTGHLFIFSLASFGVCSLATIFLAILAALRVPKAVVMPIFAIGIFASIFIVLLAWTFAYRKLSLLALTQDPDNTDPMLNNDSRI